MRRVTTEVHQCAAALFACPAQLALAVRDRHGEIRIDAHEFSEFAGAGDLDGAFHDIVMAIVEGLDQLALGIRRRLVHAPHLRGVHRERLLAQHMLAGLQSGDGPARVARRRQGVVDEIDIVAAHQFVVVLCDMRDLVFGGIGPGALRIARGNRHDFEIRIVARGVDDDGRRDLGRAQNADANFHVPLPRRCA